MNVRGWTPPSRISSGRWIISGMGGSFTISDEYDRRLKIKREVYAEQTGTTDAIHLTMVSAHGLKSNSNAFDIQSVVTLDDLFKE